MKSAANRIESHAESLIQSLRELAPDVPLLPNDAKNKEARRMIADYNALVRRIHPSLNPGRTRAIMAPAMQDWVKDFVLLHTIHERYPDGLLADELRALILLSVDELLSRFVENGDWRRAEYFTDCLSIPAARLRKAAQRGSILRVRIGGRVHYSVLDVERYLSHEQMDKPQRSDRKP